MEFRLKNRQLSIPGGLKFSQPELNWTPRPGSFHNITGQIMRVRQANPAQTQKHGWRTDEAGCADDLDRYNAKICYDNGWHNYIVQQGEGAPPLPLPRHNASLVAKLRNVVAGARTLVKWIDDKAQAVDPDEASRRADICLLCPMNAKGDLSRYFTVPVASMIRAAINLRREWQLTLPQDDKLGVCSGCDCPLKLKVWLPPKDIKEGVAEADKNNLHPNCWIRTL